MNVLASLRSQGRSLSRSPSFGEVVAGHHARGELLVQPRMGFVDPRQMRQGLLATRSARAATVGTITLDSYTRVGDHAAVRQALAAGISLNGYPIVDLDVATTPALLDGVARPGFPVQVRHGSADPRRIVRTLLACGLHATEGGPVSYCLPYSRTPLAIAVDHWRQCCELLAASGDRAASGDLRRLHDGAAVPAGLLVALSVLEGMFFWQHGVRCISLSYAQQTNAGQDEEAVAALQDLAGHYVPHARTARRDLHLHGRLSRARRAVRCGLLGEAARLAVRTGASRLIVKTAAEAHRIPDHRGERGRPGVRGTGGLERRRGADVDLATPGSTREARALIDNVLALDADIGRALVVAFAHGHLDVPYCLHPDNAGRTRSHLDTDGRLEWQRIGSMPIGDLVTSPRGERMTSADLLNALRFVERKFDHRSLDLEQGSVT